MAATIYTTRGDIQAVKSWQTNPSYGTGYVGAGKLSAGERADRDAYVRGAVKFTLPPGLTGAQVTSAYLQLYTKRYQEYAADSNDYVVNINRVTADWDESSTANPGYTSVTSVDMYKKTSEYTLVSVPITQLVKDWVDGVHANYGILLSAVGPDADTGEDDDIDESFYIEYYSYDSITYYPRIKLNLSWQVLSQSVGGATITPAGALAKLPKKSVGNALIVPEGILNDGRSESVVNVPYEFIIGPTTLGIDTREKRLRRVYLIVSKEADATMYVSVAMNENGAFGTEVAIAPGEELTMVKKYIPLAVGEASSGMVIRIKVRGEGEITVHDAGVELSVRGV